MSFVPTVNPHDRESAMQTITKHYIDGAFVESHGTEVMDIFKPTTGQVIARVTLADEERARRLASQIRAGRVVINNMTDDPQAPWGGFKYSGVGREYGRYGIEIGRA